MITEGYEHDKSVTVNNS